MVKKNKKMLSKELNSKVTELKNKLCLLFMQKSSGSLKDVSLIKKTKKQIARIYTENSKN